MASVLPALLLCLFLQCVASDKPLCMLQNATDGGEFTLTISPEYYQPDKNYTVTVNGTGTNLDVALSASYNNTGFGMWMNKAANCTGVYGIRSLPFHEIWKSDDSMNITWPVEFKAYIKVGNMTYVMSKSIPSVSMTTAAPMTTNGTFGNMSTMTYASTSMTTAGAITFKPLGGFASILLLFISVRELLF
ncbi:uncharacterized protein LOC144479867 [Mustelus asterias]